MEGYHWRDGVYFNRLPDGSVTIRVETSADKYFDVGTIPAMEWASIVRAMETTSRATGNSDLAIAQQYLDAYTGLDEYVLEAARLLSRAIRAGRTHAPTERE